MNVSTREHVAVHPASADYEPLAARAWLYLKLAVPLSVFFAAVYGAANWWAAQQGSRYQLYLDPELEIPFVPGMIWAYHSINLLFPALIFILSKAELRALARAFAVAVAVAGVSFLLFPAELGFARPTEAAGYEALYRALYALDMPHNLVPSLHQTFTVLALLIVLARRPPAAVVALFVLWAALLTASTLLTHQHHLLDVITGTALGACCLLVYRKHVAAR